MDDARKAKFEALMDETRDEINDIEREIERELAEVKERLAKLQAEKKAQLTIYSGYCQLLGLTNEFEDEAEEEPIE